MTKSRTEDGTGRYRAYSFSDLRRTPRVRDPGREALFSFEVVANVLPFRVTAYVVEALIDRGNIPDDPIFRLTFPHREMLLPHQFEKMAGALRSGADKETIRKTANSIRAQLNPHPAGQIEHNIRTPGDRTLNGIQHKYRETVLCFPRQGQTCHAYCTFCFRWPQFVGVEE